ncbi:transcriptional regulatory protein C1F7.11c 3 [Stagonosporopsis vannaccii]|nr:transcriptional regulatory protein C1F7.11c 3 [Stagonosporopsis vannaccii]
MKQVREVTTCFRCRSSKRRCDKTRPHCTRCKRGGIQCTYEEYSTTGAAELTIHDGSGRSYPTPVTTPSTTAPQARKRNRACLSCVRCHRLKIKCDQKQPCFRCSRSGVATSCQFTHKSKPSEQPCGPTTDQEQFQEVPFALTADDPSFVVATWFLRKRGSTHYRAILNRMESFASIRSTPFAIAVKHHVESHCSSDFVLPSNYPFGSPGSVRYSSLQLVHELIRNSRNDVDSLMAGYYKSFHSSLPVFDISAFEAKLADFWNQPEATDLTWLAQFLAVLGLGAYTVEHGFDTLKSGQEVAADFLYASEACLAKTTYMARPTTTAISTLCLMVIAKQATTATCWTLDTCWNVLGFIIRLAMMMVLHRDWMPGYDDPAIVKERAFRRRLWTMIIYLETQMAARTGQQSMLPQSLMNLNALTIGHGDCWDTIIPRSLPIIGQLLSRMNVHDDDIFTYDEVLEYDRKITQLINEAATFYEGGIVELTLDIFFRRALLIVHCQYALHPKAPTLYPNSYNTTLEINLALLNHYHRLSSISPHTHLLAQPYMLDFLAAALTTCMLLLADETSPACSMRGAEPGLTYRKTMLDPLMRCMDILANDNRNVLCFTTGFKQLQAIYALTTKDSPLQ